MAVITDSPDIGVLEVKVTMNLSGSSPVITLENQTTPNQNTSPIPDLSSLIWVLNIYSPTGTPILVSDFDNPWMTGVWTTEQILDAWPRPFGQIEWSGADYRIEFQVKDSNDTIYDLYKSATLCRPVGNTRNIKNTYGQIVLTVEVLCEQAQLYLKDNTAKTYQGITGVLNSGFLAVDYPRDPTGVIPAPFEITSFTTDALVPFNYNGNGYEATYYSLYTYDLGDNVFVVIRYTAQIDFPVQCNIDLCPLACAVKELEESITSGKCDDVIAAQNKLNLITPKLLRAFIAKANPTCGIDLPALIDEIKAIGGFGCDCYGAASGIGTQSALISGLLFSVNNQGGDIVASFEVTGNNVILNVKDKSYTFGGSCASDSSAIAFVTTTTDTNKNVCLQVNINQLATDIYTATQNNSTLLNLLNSLIVNNGFNLTIDGKCIINSGACDYSYTLSNIPANTTFAAMFNIVSNGVTIPLSFSFNGTNLVALQTYLNTLGIGTFVVTDIGGNQVTIVSSTNTYGLGQLIYIDSTVAKKSAVVTTDCTGFAPISINAFGQAVVDYLCGLTDAQVETAAEYTICYIDPVSKTRKTSVIAAGEALTTFIVELLSKGCDTITYLMTLPQLNCATIQAVFPSSAAVMQENDFVLGAKGGSCARILPVELGTRIFQMGLSNAEFMTAVCAAVAACAGGYKCEAYSTFEIATVENSPYDNKLDIIVTFVHPSAISNIIRYARIDLGGTLSWTTIPVVLPGASPYEISNLDDGQYVVGITPVYSDGRVCSESFKNTDVCGAINSFSAVLTSGDIVVSYSATSPKIKIAINYPNGGTFSQIYTNTGSDITITPPANLYGFFYVTIQAVCNEATSWFGPVSAPAVVEITPANNSTIENGTTNDLTIVSLKDGSTTYTTTPIIAIEGIHPFFIADGFYPILYLAVLTGTTGQATLTTTGSPAIVGTYYNVVDDVHGFYFENVQVLDGIAILVIDSSP